MNAKWIVPADCNGGKNYYFRVRKHVIFTEPPHTAPFRITADNSYRLLVNGQEVRRGPVRGSATLQYYDRIELAPFLRTGVNELLIEAYSLGEENFTIHSIAPGVLAELEGICATDESWEAQSAREWRRDVPNFTVQIGRMECRDLRLTSEHWGKAKPADERLNAKQLTENLLPPPREVEHRAADLPVWRELGGETPEDLEQLGDFLDAEPVAPIAPERLLRPGSLLSARPSCVLLPNGRGVRLVCDFDHEVSGRFEAELDAPAGTVVDVTYGEVLKGERIASRFPHPKYHFTDRYLLREGKNQIGTTLAERGFRMVQLSIRNFDRPVTIRRLSGIDRRYPFARRGSFFSSDFRLNRIFEVCAETLSACAADTFMDCPWRERGFWVNDMIVNNAANLCCFGAEEIHRHCFELAFSQPGEDGLVSGICPMPRQSGEISFVFAPTNLFLVLMLRDYWLFSGDGETVRRYLPNLERIFNAIWALADEHGIPTTRGLTAEWNFYDWAFELNEYSFNGQRESMLPSLFVLATGVFAELAERLGYQYDADELQRRRDLTAANVEPEFLDPATGLLTDAVLHRGKPAEIQSQLAHAFWLLTGRATPEHRARFEAALDSDRCLMPEYYLHYFWFRAAEPAGLNAVGLERIRHYWGRCIETGSPTLYEAGIHKFGRDAMGESGSLCHGFGTIPVEFLQRAILGVTPLEPGFAKFRFAPQLFDLTFANGRIPAPTGNIVVALTPGKAHLTLPFATCAVLDDGREFGPGTHEINF